MKLEELFTQLSYGELSNLKMGDEGSGDLTVTDQKKIINHTQQALTNLYSRFCHNKDFVTLRQDGDITKYRIHPSHAVNHTTPANLLPRYIIDSIAEPFEQPIIKIRSIKRIKEDGTLCTNELLINDDTREGSIKTLSYDRIMITKPVHDEELFVEIQLNHPVIPLPVDLNYEIQLAPALEEALILKVASRIFASMNGEENLMKASTLSSGYEQICQMVTAEDLLQISSSEDANRFAIGGWT